MPGIRADEDTHTNDAVQKTVSRCQKYGFCSIYLWGMVIMLGSFKLYADTIDNSGQEPYEQCGYCHEYDGNTRMADFPRLAGQWPAYLQKQLNDFRSHRRISSHMNPTAELLSDQDIGIVVNYFSSQIPRALSLPPQSDAERLRAGELFSKGDAARGLPACIQCHGDRGQGQGQAKIPNIAGQQPDYLQTQLLAFKSGRRANDPNQQMRQVASLLSDAEIILLKDFLARMQPVKALANRVGFHAEPGIVFNSNPSGQATQSLH